MKPLKLFYFRHLISAKLTPSPLLFPFLGPTIKKTTPFVSGVFKKINYDPKYLVLVNQIEEADCLVLPNNYWMTKKYNPGLIGQYLRFSKMYAIPLLVDAYGDSTQPINIPNSVILRTSAYRQTKRRNEIIIPAYTQDLLEDFFDNKLVLRLWQPVPTVGFVGWGKSSWATKPGFWLKRNFFPLRPDTEGLVLRQKVFAALENNKELTTNFIFRDSYSGHINMAKGKISKLRQEFVANISSNDYTVCVRGAGNYSYRFYETLSLGRIPLVLDTDLALPLEEKIDYRKFCLFVKISDIDKVGKILLNFHRRLTPEEFTRKQKMARDAFANHLRIDKYTMYLTDEIKRRL